jgi:3-deoxy-D-manno-octulosonate 8-phosphate phosphatase (KDO 8-P phosphatase)
MITHPETVGLFGGNFITDFSVIKNKLRNIKAFVFDWDGVFNNGQKNIEGHSGFSEVDSMGINMLRFNVWLFQRKIAPAAIISGEENGIASFFAARENFSASYRKIKNKEQAFLHFCKLHECSPSEVLFVFDDILDLPIAKLAGLRMMVSRRVNPMTVQYATQNRLVDYLTEAEGGSNAVREICELCLLLSNNFQKVVELRTRYAPEYRDYIAARAGVSPSQYLLRDEEIVSVYAQ